MAKRKPKLPAARAADMAAIVAKLDAGADMTQIGKEYGVSRQAVYSWLLGGAGDIDCHDLVTRALTARVANADETLEAADTALDVARARERMRFTRMDLERRRPALYGPKQEVKLQVSTDMAERLAEARDRLRRRVVEGEASQIADGSHGAGGTV